MNEKYKNNDPNEINKKFEIARSKIEAMKSGSNFGLDDISRLVVDFTVLKIDYQVLRIENAKTYIKEGKQVNNNNYINNILNYINDSLLYLERQKNKIFLKQRLEYWKKEFERACLGLQDLKSKSDKNPNEISSLLELFTRLQQTLPKGGRFDFGPEVHNQLQQNINYLKMEQNKSLSNNNDNNLLQVWYDKLRVSYEKYRILVSKDMKVSGEVQDLLSEFQNLKAELNNLYELAGEDLFNEYDAFLSRCTDSLIKLSEIFEDTSGINGFHR